MSEKRITGLDIQKQVRHWLKTPINGYLGSSYGQDTKALLQRPMSAGIADDYLAKLKRDVPILGMLPADSVNIYGRVRGNEAMDLMIEVAGQGIAVEDLEN